MRKVVVTGLGMISPLGLDVKSSWQNILSAQSGVDKINSFDATAFPSKIAGHVKNFNPDDFIDPRLVKKMDLFIQYGMAASAEAIKDSGLMLNLSQEDCAKIGVIVGSGIGGLRIIEQTSIDFHRDKRKVSPFFIPTCLINLTSGYIAIEYGFTGPNHSVATACTTGAHAIGDAARMIKYGDADVMIAGSCEAAITPVGVAGFAAAKALSTNFNDRPQHASRPWDLDRDGFVIAEGAGIVVLEELERAKARGAKIYGQILGYGMSGDAFHVTSPHPEGRGAKLAMQAALRDAKCDFADVGYINAHGTSTKMGDTIELNAVQELFYPTNPGVMMSSTKSATGHLLGAAGSVEAIFSILAINDAVAPPTINLENPEPNVLIDLVPKQAKPKAIKVAMTNSFGFGGTNASLVLGKF
jgi:3-oxoacyl-[acyl-carrier-protein] synthase II